MSLPQVDTLFIKEIDKSISIANFILESSSLNIGGKEGKKIKSLKKSILTLATQDDLQRIKTFCETIISPSSLLSSTTSSKGKWHWSQLFIGFIHLLVEAQKIRPRDLIDTFDKSQSKEWYKDPWYYSYVQYFGTDDAESSDLAPGSSSSIQSFQALQTNQSFSSFSSLASLASSSTSSSTIGSSTRAAAASASTTSEQTAIKSRATFINLIGMLPYLRTLGFKNLFLLPHYESPNGDGGYDVSSYTPSSKLGGADKWKRFLTQARASGIKVVTDAPFNHTSTEHPWFKAALKGDPTYIDYYIDVSGRRQVSRSTSPDGITTCTYEDPDGSILKKQLIFPDATSYHHVAFNIPGFTSPRLSQKPSSNAPVGLSKTFSQIMTDTDVLIDPASTSLPTPLIPTKAGKTHDEENDELNDLGDDLFCNQSDEDDEEDDVSSRPSQGPLGGSASIASISTLGYWGDLPGHSSDSLDSNNDGSADIIVNVGMNEQNPPGEGKTYFYSTFYPFQMDLNLRNPRVILELLIILAQELNEGISGKRFDAALFWLQPKANGLPLGSQDYNNHEHSIFLLQLFKIFSQLLAPQSIFIPEIFDDSTTLASFAGKPIPLANEGRQILSGGEALMNFQVQCALRETLYLASATPLWTQLKSLPKLPNSATWFNLLEHHDETYMNFMTPSNRKLLLRYIEERGGVPFKGGDAIGARLANCLNSHPQRIANGIFLLYNLSGTPMIYYGLEIGQKNSYAFAELRKSEQYSLLQSQGLVPEDKTEDDFYDPRELVRGPLSHDLFDVADEAEYPGIEVIKSLNSLREEWLCLGADSKLSKLEFTTQGSSSEDTVIVGVKSVSDEKYKSFLREQKGSSNESNDGQPATPVSASSSVSSLSFDLVPDPSVPLLLLSNLAHNPVKISIPISELTDWFNIDPEDHVCVEEILGPVVYPGDAAADGWEAEIRQKTVYNVLSLEESKPMSRQRSKATLSSFFSASTTTLREVSSQGHHGRGLSIDVNSVGDEAQFDELCLTSPDSTNQSVHALAKYFPDQFAFSPVSSPTAALSPKAGATAYSSKTQASKSSEATVLYEIQDHPDYKTLSTTVAGMDKYPAAFERLLHALDSPTDQESSPNGLARSSSYLSSRSVVSRRAKSVSPSALSRNSHRRKKKGDQPKTGKTSGSGPKVLDFNQLFPTPAQYSGDNGSSSDSNEDDNISNKAVARRRRSRSRSSKNKSRSGGLLSHSSSTRSKSEGGSRSAFMFGPTKDSTMKRLKPNPSPVDLDSLGDADTLKSPGRGLIQAPDSAGSFSSIGSADTIKSTQPGLAASLSTASISTTVVYSDDETNTAQGVSAQEFGGYSSNTTGTLVASPLPTSASDTDNAATLQRETSTPFFLKHFAAKEAAAASSEETQTPRAELRERIYEGFDGDELQQFLSFLNDRERAELAAASVKYETMRRPLLNALKNKKLFEVEEESQSQTQTHLVITIPAYGYFLFNVTNSPPAHSPEMGSPDSVIHNI